MRLGSKLSRRKIGNRAGRVAGDAPLRVNELPLPEEGMKGPLRAQQAAEFANAVDRRRGYAREAARKAVIVREKKRETALENQISAYEKGLRKR